MKTLVLVLACSIVSTSFGRPSDEDEVSNLHEQIDVQPGNLAATNRLIELARTTDDRIAAVAALSALGEAMPFVPNESRVKIASLLVTSCRNKWSDISRQAYRELSKFAKPGEIPPEIISEGISHRNSDVAKFAAECVLRTKEFEPQIVDALLGAIESGKRSVALETITAVKAIAAMPDPPNVAFATLFDALEANDREVQSEAVLTLAKWRSDDPRVMLAVKDCSSVPNFFVRMKALDATAELLSARSNPDLLEIVRQATTDRNPAVRERAQQILVDLGKHHKLAEEAD